MQIVKSLVCLYVKADKSKQWHSQGRSSVQSDLFGDLSKIINEPDGGRLLQRVIDVVNVHLSFIEQVMEHVDCLYSWWTLLLVAKNEVNPFMEVS